MINFSKQSWHYKLYVKMYGNWGIMPQTICPYFWKVVWAALVSYVLWPIVCIPFLVVCGLVVSVLTLSIPWFILSMVTGHNEASPLWGVSFYHWKALLVDLGVWSVAFAVGFAYHRLKFKREDGPAKDNPPVVVEWVKAKKSRFCPMIKFKD